MTIKLDNEYFEEIKEIPGFEKRFGVLVFTLDNSEPLIEEAGADEKYSIRYNLTENSIEPISRDGETLFEQYTDCDVVGIPRDWGDYFHGAIECEDQNGQFVMVYYGDDNPDSMDESLDEKTKEILCEAINPYSVMEFAEEVIDAIRYEQQRRRNRND